MEELWIADGRAESDSSASPHILPRPSQSGAIGRWMRFGRYTRDHEEEEEQQQQAEEEAEKAEERASAPASGAELFPPPRRCQHPTPSAGPGWPAAPRQAAGTARPAWRAQPAHGAGKTAVCGQLAALPPRARRRGQGWGAPETARRRR
jgi:hypothetical protein